MRLISPGAEPRAQLRYHVEPLGQTAIVDVWIAPPVFEDAMDQTPGEMAHRMFMLRIEPRRMTADGQVTYEYLLRSADWIEPGSPSSNEKADLAKLKGLSGTCVASSRGLVSNATTTTMQQDTNEFEPMLRRVMSQLVTPLPEEAVGIGAQWQHSDVALFGDGVDELTYTLVSRTGDRGTIDVTQRTSVRDRTVHSLGSTDIAFTKGTATGTGDITFSLLRIPQDLSLSSTSRATIVIKGVGSRRAVQRTRIQIRGGAKYALQSPPSP